MGFSIGSAILTILGAAELAGVVIVGTLTVGAVVGTAILTAGLIGLNYLLAQKPQQQGQSGTPPPEAGHIPLRQPITARIAGYGRTRIAGAYMLYEELNGISYDVLALHSGKMCGIVQHYLHEDRVVLDADGYVLAVISQSGGVSPNNDGRYVSLKRITADAVNAAIAGAGSTPLPTVIAALYATKDDPQNDADAIRIKIDTRLGLETETNYADITAAFPVEWDATHRGDGVASLALTCQSASAEKFQTVYPNGKPEPSVVADLLPLWDFRDTDQDPDDPDTWVDYPDYSAATTYASGDRRLYGGVVYISAIGSNTGNTPDENPGKWVSAFSNPVLQVVDYLTDVDHGMGLDRDLLITPSIAALSIQADLCDVIVETADGIGEPRYRSDGFFTFENDPADVLAPILATCDGWLIVDGEGALSLKVGQYSAPIVELNDRHIIGGSVQYGVSDKDVINELALTFTDTGNNYKTEPGQPWRNEDDISNRGKVRSQPFGLSWVQSHSQGRRLAKRAMARLASPLRGKLITTLYGLAALGQRFVRLDYTGSPSMADIIVEVQKVETDFTAGRVTFEWVLVDPDSIDAWDAATEEGSPPPNPDAINGGSVPIPEGLGGEIVGNRLELFIDDPERADLSYVLRYRLVDDGDGDPGVWTQEIFTTPTIIDGKVYFDSFHAVGDTFEIQAAFQGPGGSYGDFCESLFLGLTLPMLDRSKPQNSGYQLMGWM